METHSESSTQPATTKPTKTSFDYKEFNIVLRNMVGIWIGAATLLIIFICIKGTNKTGLTGDTFGIINSLFSCLAFGALWYSIKLQKQELTDTREVLKNQNENIKQQVFETTFLNMLKANNDILQTLKDGDARGVQIFRKIMKTFHDELNKHTIEKTYDFEKSIFNTISKTPIYNMKQYLYSLDMLLQFIDKHFGTLEHKKQKEWYLGMIESTFSNRQKQFLNSYLAYWDRFTIGHAMRLKSLMQVANAHL